MILRHFKRSIVTDDFLYGIYFENKMKIDIIGLSLFHLTLARNNNEAKLIHLKNPSQAGRFNVLKLFLASKYILKDFNLLLCEGSSVFKRAFKTEVTKKRRFCWNAMKSRRNAAWGASVLSEQIVNINRCSSKQRRKKKVIKNA